MRLTGRCGEVYRLEATPTGGRDLGVSNPDSRSAGQLRALRRRMYTGQRDLTTDR